MKFLLNMNVPRTLIMLLAAHGHVCRHAGDIGLAQASDVAVLEAARGNIAAPLNDGAVVILEDVAMRIRRLPIAGED